MLITFCGCETTHTSMKLIVNNSSHTFQIDYNNFWAKDSILTFSPGELKYLTNATKLGNHPKELPYPPCSMQPNDTLLVLTNNFTFIGDFTDEYRWNESISGKRATVHQCTFTITDGDFQ